MNQCRVTVCVMTGMGMESHVISIPVDDLVMKELLEPQELSNDPFTRLFSSFDRREDIVKVRERKFKMREEVAREIANALTKGLVEYFGDGDTIDGYRKDKR